MSVFLAINRVQDELSKIGIAKGQKNQQQRYNFRGIDDVLNSLAPLLAKHKLVILPEVTAREEIERKSKAGGTLIFTTLNVTYKFISVDDGSEASISVVGQANDSADKSVNKALSAAYKYGMIQAFCIPIEGMDDSDGVTLDIGEQQPQRKPTPKQMQQESDSDRLERLAEALSMAQTEDELRIVWKGISQTDKATLEAIKNTRKEMLSNQGE